MQHTIPFLQKNDLIEIVAPAKRIEAEHVFYARDFLVNAGFRVRISAHCLGGYHYFSGSVDERLSDFQSALDDPEVKAILCARGGYGSLHLIDRLNWSGFVQNPKWLIGFSDITVFHQRLHLMGYPSIHGSMPLNFAENTEEALRSLLNSLIGKLEEMTVVAGSQTIPGNASGELIGGNLSVLYGLLGTNDQVDYTGKILLIEDLCEPIYHLDRMFYALKKSGALGRISGLVVGGMTDLKDSDPPFGMNYRELIHSFVHDLGIPLAFDFPMGHFNDNRAVVFGIPAALRIDESTVSLRYLG